MKNILITEEIIFWIKLDCNIKYIYIIYVATNIGAFRHSYSIDTNIGAFRHSYSIDTDIGAFRHSYSIDTNIGAFRHSYSIDTYWGISTFLQHRHKY